MWLASGTEPPYRSMSMGHRRGPRPKLTPATAASPLYIGQFGGDTDRLSGTIDEVRIYSKALSSAEITSDMNTAIGPTKPGVSITSPTAGATVSNTITVSATASDNVAVGGVQFTLDGANLGPEDTSSPYSVSWSTASSQNGTHLKRASPRHRGQSRNRTKCFGDSE